MKELILVSHDPVTFQTYHVVIKNENDATEGHTEASMSPINADGSVDTETRYTPVFVITQATLSNGANSHFLHIRELESLNTGRARFPKFPGTNTEEIALPTADRVFEYFNQLVTNDSESVTFTPEGNNYSIEERHLSCLLPEGFQASAENHQEETAREENSQGFPSLQTLYMLLTQASRSAERATQSAATTHSAATLMTVLMSTVDPGTLREMQMNPPPQRPFFVVSVLLIEDTQDREGDAPEPS